MKKGKVRISLSNAYAYVLFGSLSIEPWEFWGPGDLGVWGSAGDGRWEL